MLVLLLFAAPAVHAGVTFDFLCEKSGSAPYSFRGRGYVHGRNVRYDITDGSHPVFNPGITIISKDGGRVLLILDHRQKTFFYRTTAAMAGPISTYRAPGAERVSHIAAAAGGDELRVTYRIDSTLDDAKLRSEVVAISRVTFLDIENEAVPFGLHFVFKSGFEAVDKRIAGIRAGKGLPVEEHVSVTRTISGGEPVTESITVKLSNVKQEPVLASFDPPATYRLEEPTFEY